MGICKTVTVIVAIPVCMYDVCMQAAAPHRNAGPRATSHTRKALHYTPAGSEFMHR